MKKIMLSMIRFYQRKISPAFPPRCRYHPTCSAYAVEAITKYGAVKGGWLTFKRLMRCHPFSKHPYFDPVP
ncbi:MAG: membrane protein insertion efficiency factor YidD [Oscillospiraceae bacterium]|nr:membrane protein insertion efficiency factor YidD [Oscillospiraceae bacterium]